MPAHKEKPHNNEIAASTMSVRRRIGHMLSGFGCDGAQDWPETHPIAIGDLQSVELAIQIEAEFDIEFRDDLVPEKPVLGDFVRMVEAAMSAQ